MKPLLVVPITVVLAACGARVVVTDGSTGDGITADSPIGQESGSLRDPSTCRLDVDVATTTSYLRLYSFPGHSVMAGRFFADREAVITHTSNFGSCSVFEVRTDTGAETGTLTVRTASGQWPVPQTVDGIYARSWNLPIARGLDTVTVQSSGGAVAAFALEVQVPERVAVTMDGNTNGSATWHVGTPQHFSWTASAFPVQVLLIGMGSTATSIKRLFCTFPGESGGGEIPAAAIATFGPQQAYGNATAACVNTVQAGGQLVWVEAQGDLDPIPGWEITIVP